MGNAFFPARGCVYKVDDTGQSGKGFYSIQGLDSGSSDPSSGIILIQGINFQNNDIVQQVVTLENTKILYTFGSDFGNISINGELLLGPAGGNGGLAFNQLLSFFQANRVSQTQASVGVSLPNGNYFATYITGLIIGDINPEIHVQQFVFIGTVAVSLK